MKWNDFAVRVREVLTAADSRYIDCGRAFPNEHALTREIALGLRKLFSESFGVHQRSDLPYHVVYRNGDDRADRDAWRLIKRVKWVNVRGLNFVPDVLVLQHRMTSDTDDPGHVLPIEVKLVKQRACSG